MTREEAHIEYRRLIDSAVTAGAYRSVMRELARTDLFFLGVYICGRWDLDEDWLYERCREVQEESDGFLDLWAREHYKSTIITFLKSLQDILNDAEVTIGIFSFTRPIAKQFLRQIKRELENNEKLKGLFPDILWADPHRDAKKWSENEGIVVKRRGNPKEATVEAWGLVDGQPTSKHFKVRVYDDTVSRESVTTPEQIAKTTEGWELSLNLGARGGVERYVGTRWHYNDTYKVIRDRNAAVPRVHPATQDGTWDTPPVLFTPQELAEKRQKMGPYVAAAQLLLNPILDETQGFKESWIRYWPARRWHNMNIYILVDPANEKKKDNDYTVFTVMGLGTDRNYYIVTWVRDRLNLTERANVLFKLHQQYSPIDVGYEKYGMMSDDHYMRERMDQTNYRFNITALGGPMPKPDRIKRLVPIAEQGRLYVPETCPRVDYQHQPVDLTREFMTEIRDFPFCEHDDMLDSAARIMEEDLNATFPSAAEGDAFGLAKEREPHEAFDPLTWGLE